jgi:hypothetical protein
MIKIDIVKNIHAMGVRKAKVSSLVEGYHLKNLRKAEQATNQRIAQHDARQLELEQVCSDRFSKFERKERLALQKGKVLGQDAPNAANLTPERKVLIQKIKEEKALNKEVGEELAYDVATGKDFRKEIIQNRRTAKKQPKQEPGQNLDITSKSDNSTTKADETKSGWTTTQKVLAWAGGGLAALGGGAAIFSKNQKDKQIRETVHQAA